MKNLYRFKWPLIFFCCGLTLEKFGTVINKKESYAETILIIGYWLVIIGLLGLIWKLLWIENK